MKTEYRVIFTMTFDNVTDRDSAYTKIKNGLVSIKATLPTYKISALTKDDYNIPDSITESF